MRHSISHSKRVARAAFAAVAAIALMHSQEALAQQPVASVAGPALPGSAPVPAAAVTPAAAIAPAPTVSPAAPVTAQAPSASTVTGTVGSNAAPGANTPNLAVSVTKSASPEDANPFSNVKTTDDKSLKQELPVLEQRLKSVEDRMTAIQQVQVALPADALNGPGGVRTPGAGGAGTLDQQAMELEAATFVACVNGQAMFRDSDQKPFFVNAKEANQNEAVRRIGGCKH